MRRMRSNRGRLPLAQSETLTFTGTGAEWKPMFKGPRCRLLVILLVVSSLRLSEYSRSTRRRIKPSGRDFLFSRASQSKLGLFAVTRRRTSLNDDDC